MNSGCSFLRFDPRFLHWIKMHPSSCMFGPPQGTAAQFSNKTPYYSGTTSTTWQSEQMSGYGQPANAYSMCENGLVSNRTSNWQSWQSVTPTEASRQQLNHFINANQHHSSLNAHNGQYCLSNGSFSVQNFQPQGSELTSSSSPNTNIYSKQDMSQLWTQKHTNVGKQPISAQKPSFLTFCLTNKEKQKVAPNCNDQLDKQISLQTTTSHPQGVLKDSQISASSLTYNQKMVNNRHDTQTQCQEGLPAFAQRPRHNCAAAQAKTSSPTKLKYGAGKHIFQHSNVSQTTRQHQRQVNPAVNFADNITHQKHGHQIRSPRIGLDQCKAQTGSSNGSTHTGMLYIHNDRMIPQRQSNHNTVHATLTTPVTSNLDTPQSLPIRSGQASPTSNASNPSATVDYNNCSLEKKSLKAVAVVQPLEQECCQKDVSKNNSCDTVKAYIDKSATDEQFKTSEMQQDKSCNKALGFQPSSVTTVPWTIETLTKLLEDNEKAQQKEIMELTKLNALSSICHVTDKKIEFLESDNVKRWHFTLSSKAANFCRHYVTKDCVILTQVKGSYDEQLQNYYVLKHNELFSETPYKSQWLNVGELDDIDKEFGYASCLIHGAKKQSDQEVTSIPAQIVNDKCVEGVTLIEPEITDPGEEKRLPTSAERKNSVELTQDQAPTPIEDSSVDSSDSDLSFEIHVLPPEEAKVMFEQIQKKTEEAIAIDCPPETDTRRSDQGKLPGGGNVTEGDKRASVSHTEHCCLPKFISTFVKDNSCCKCQCESAKNPEDSPENSRTQEKETAKEIKENLSVSLSCSLAKGVNKEIGEFKIDSQTMIGLNRPVASMENKRDCLDSNMGPIQKDKNCSRNPMLYHLLIGEIMDTDMWSHAKIQSRTKVNCTVAASNIEKTCRDTELKSTDMTSDSSEGTEEQSSSSEMATLEDLATKVKKRPCEEERFYPTLKESKKCSNQVDVKPLCPESQEEVVDLTEDEPMPSSESPSVGQVLLGQGKDEDNLSDVEIQLDANVDDIILVSDSGNTRDTTSDSLAATEAQSPSSEMAMAEGFAPKMNTCSLPDDVKSLSPKSQEVTVHLPPKESLPSSVMDDVKSMSPKSQEVTVYRTRKESLPSKEKVVKLFLFGSSSHEKMTFVKRPPKVLSIKLSSLKESPSKPILMQEQSAKQRVYEKWKTSIVPVLAVGKRKSSLLGGHRKRAAFVGSTVTENVPIRSESGICKRKQNEKIGLKLKRRRLLSTGKPVEWKVGSVPATEDQDSATVPLRENDVRMFRIPNTF